MISPETPRRARLFWNGRSQAVRLPREFRFDGSEVEVRREGDAVILEPVRKQGWPHGYWAWVESVREELDLGEIESLDGALRDLTLEEE